MRRAFFFLTMATGLCASASFAQWANLVDETSSRLIAAPSLVLNDNLEKDFGFGDFDHDGDIDIAVGRKFPGSIQGQFANMLLMNEHGVLVDRTAEFASASDVPGDNGFLTGTNDRDMATYDINNDGWLDLITATTMSDNVSALLGQPRVYINLGADGSGNWLGFRFEDSRIPELKAKNGTTANPRFCELAVGDLTGDGFADLFFVDYDTPETSGTVCIDLNGNGSTADPGECQASPGESGTKDYDNKFLVNWGTDPTGPGAGFFFDTTNTRMTSTQLASAFGAAAQWGDYNADGVMDVARVSTLTSGQNISIIYGKPGAQEGLTFTGPDNIYGNAPYAITPADLNNDGKLDLVATDDGKDRMLINTGNGADGLANFTATSITSSLSEFGNTIKVTDLDNDGLTDAFIADVDGDLPPFCPSSGRRAHLYHNTFSGTINGNTLQEVGQIIPNAMLNATYDFAPIDLNGDGWTDLVIGRCAGIQVWMNHTGDGLAFSFPNGAPTQLSTSSPTVFDVQATVSGSATLESPTLNYRINGGAWQTSDLSGAGPLFTASLPAADCNSIVDYYVSGTLDTNDAIYTAPIGAPTNLLSAFSAATFTTVVADDIEGSTAGWTVSAAGGLTSGGWVAVVPNGTTNAGEQAAPSSDNTPGAGTTAWVTGNGTAGGAANASDVDAGTATLETQVFDLAGSDGIISYARWFYCDDEAVSGADALVIEISNDGGSTWTQVEFIAAAPSAWITHTFYASDIVATTATMKLRFSISDKPENSVTEAGVDDFSVTKIECGATNPCPADLDGSGIVDGADLGALLAAWGGNGAADLDGSGTVDGADLGALLAAWGGCV